MAIVLIDKFTSQVMILLTRRCDTKNRYQEHAQEAHHHLGASPFPGAATEMDEGDLEGVQRAAPPTLEALTSECRTECEGKGEDYTPMTAEVPATETSRTGWYTRARLVTEREEPVTESPERLLVSIRPIPLGPFLPAAWPWCLMGPPGLCGARRGRHSHSGTAARLSLRDVHTVPSPTRTWP